MWEVSPGSMMRSVNKIGVRGKLQKGILMSMCVTQVGRWSLIFLQGEDTGEFATNYLSFERSSPSSLAHLVQINYNSQAREYP